MRSVIAGLLFSLHAFAAVAQPTYMLKQAEPDTGSHIRKPVATTRLYPLDKTWARLSPDERANLRRFYENMPDGDEPPFPVDGMEAVARDLSDRAGSVEYEGNLKLHVTVDSEGRVTSVDLLEVKDLRRGKFLAQAFLDVRFKPAVCAGKPCTMQFPFYFRMERP